MPTVRPIKVPAGATHAEPSWKERLRQVAEEYKAKGGARGVYQRAVMDFAAWRGPGGEIPILLDKASVDSPQSSRTNLANQYIGKRGSWMRLICATGQPLYVWVPVWDSLSEKSPLRRSFVVQDSTGYRHAYAPATVIGILRRGYPDGSR